jgi:quinol monooxygenase YgiN
VDKVTVLYKVVAKPGRGDDVVALYEEWWATFEAEPGTEQYVLNRSLDDSDVLWCTEMFTNRAVLEEHRAAARNSPYVSKLQELVDSAESFIGTPLKAIGVAL